MILHVQTFSLTVLILSLLAHSAAAQDFARQRLNNWHQWRGPEANGFAPAGDPPSEWSETKNVKWKVPLPGEGSATPIVWGDRIFILAAIPLTATDEPTASLPRVTPQQVFGQPQPAEQPARRGGPRRGVPVALPTVPHKFEVLCLDRRTGKTIWQKTAREVVPHEGHHQTSTFAAASPVTDGKSLFVSFGSRGIFAFDLDGNPRWDKNLGQMKTRNAFGEGASPALYNDTLVVPWDHESGSFIVAFDAASGNEKWRKPREEITTWATPLIVPHAGRVQVITNGMNRVRSYDLANGEVIWECGGQGPNPIPSPVLVGDQVVVMTGYQRFAAYAIPLDSKGDITDTDKPAWKLNDGTPYVSSPLVYDGILYFTKDRNNLLTSVDARTGEVLVDKKRLPDVSTVYSSPVGAAGRVYLSSREGNTVVLEHGRGKELKVLATNSLEGAIDASPAIVGKELFLRTATHLYCIATTP
jgi:outer membrane protein assembly factor BamB